MGGGGVDGVGEGIEVGGGGLLLVCDTYGVWSEWEFFVLLADQHWKWSCLASVSTCFWPQGTVYTLQQVAQSAQFQPVHGAGNF